MLRSKPTHYGSTAVYEATQKPTSRRFLRLFAYTVVFFLLTTAFLIFNVQPFTSEVPPQNLAVLAAATETETPEVVTKQSTAAPVESKSAETKKSKAPANFNEIGCMQGTCSGLVGNGGNLAVLACFNQVVQEECMRKIPDPVGKQVLECGACHGCYVNEPKPEDCSIYDKYINRQSWQSRVPAGIPMGPGGASGGASGSTSSTNWASAFGNDWASQYGASGSPKGQPSSGNVLAAAPVAAGPTPVANPGDDFQSKFRFPGATGGGQGLGGAAVGDWSKYASAGGDWSKYASAGGDWSKYASAGGDWNKFESGFMGGMGSTGGAQSSQPTNGAILAAGKQEAEKPALNEQPEKSDTTEQPAQPQQPAQPEQPAQAPQPPPSAIGNFGAGWQGKYRFPPSIPVGIPGMPAAGTPAGFPGNDFQGRFRFPPGMTGTGQASGSTDPAAVWMGKFMPGAGEDFMGGILAAAPASASGPVAMPGDDWQGRYRLPAAGTPAGTPGADFQGRYRFPPGMTAGGSPADVWMGKFMPGAGAAPAADGTAATPTAAGPGSVFQKYRFPPSLGSSGLVLAANPAGDWSKYAGKPGGGSYAGASGSGAGDWSKYIKQFGSQGTKFGPDWQKYTSGSAGKGAGKSTTGETKQ